MFNLNRKCNCCKENEKVSIFEIGKKLLIENSFSETKKHGSRWKISSKFILFYKLCFPCYGVLFALVYLKYILEFTTDTNGNLFLVFLNMIIILLPIIIIGIAILYIVGIECRNDKN